ncbi:Type II CAAX prenyl endopeptidase Rce1-like [Dillenia turbinata]|uniref:Type II CAAX prenyl endopeptidase Rce1-like n=1 Tax=Dillenia turbinata TaxID=194707 RepID=A0AAN8Z0M3_9MAGN
MIPVLTPMGIVASGLPRDASLEIIPSLTLSSRVALIFMNYLRDVGNSMVKEIISGVPISKTACILIYCILTPLLEETIYRGFLLKSLVANMKWQQAVVVSSVIFSAAHLSGENSLQLFTIGCVLGCCYFWSGNLRSFTIRSLYNAVILMSTLLS